MISDSIQKVIKKTKGSIPLRGQDTRVNPFLPTYPAEITWNVGTSGYAIVQDFKSFQDKHYFRE